MATITTTCSYLKNYHEDDFEAQSEINWFDYTRHNRHIYTYI